MKILMTCVASLIILSFYESTNAQQLENCYTTEIYRELIKNHPEILSKREELERHTQDFSTRFTSPNQSGNQVLIIPLVFHIIHNYGGENISDAQVIDQVRILNDDFRKRSYDTASIDPVFRPIAADCEIEFRLATLDPDGHCTTGIEHIPSLLTYYAEDNAKLNPWPADRYLNIWVVASLAWSGTAAYAYYPGTAPPGADGVITASGYVGSIGNGSVGRSRVMTHEVGHCLNLSHLWGDTNDPGVSCGDDHVGDTPTTIGWRGCNLNASSCGSPRNNVQNYMEYSYCFSMFTEGQKARMRATLNSSIGGRNNLWTPANLLATGTDGSPSQVCSLVCDFKATNRTMCAGSSFQFQDLTWNGNATSRSWSFPGGSPSFSTDSMPLVTYNTPGSYDVTLLTTNSVSTDSITKSLYITVNGTNTQPIPYSESFEFVGSFPGDGYVNNPDNGNTWQRVTNAGSTGIGSIMINHFSGNPIGEMDEYITPAIDLSGIQSPTMSFKLAYAQHNASDTTSLKIYISTNCGQTWTLRYSKAGGNLSTGGFVSIPFVPTVSQWRNETVSILPFQNYPNVRFKFQSINRGGNNMYVDDINVRNLTTGIADPEIANASLTVYPNPTSGNFDLTLITEKKQLIALRITDAAGREISTVVHAEIPAGEYRYTVTNNLEAGIYFISLFKEGRSFIKKLVVTK